MEHIAIAVQRGNADIMIQAAQRDRGGRWRRRRRRTPARRTASSPQRAGQGVVARQGGERQQRQGSLAHAWAARLIGLSFDEADNAEDTQAALGAALPSAAAIGGEAPPAAGAEADDMQNVSAGGCGGQGPALQQSGVPVSAPQQHESRPIVEVAGDSEVVHDSVRGMEVEVEVVESGAGELVDCGAGGSDGGPGGCVDAL
jgi:hypothetical protein